MDDEKTQEQETRDGMTMLMYALIAGISFIAGMGVMWLALLFMRTIQP